MRPYLKEMRYSALEFKFRNETLYEVNVFTSKKRLQRQKNGLDAIDSGPLVLKT
jgi:hypothetical protein